MVDELAKQCLVIPVNLSTGNASQDYRTPPYPPPDTRVMNWFIRYRTAASVPDCCLAFVQALLEHTLAALQKDFVAEADSSFLCLCSAFRDRMQEGLRWGVQGPYRKTFYNDVINTARELYLAGYERTNRQRIYPTLPVAEACARLVQYLYQVTKDERLCSDSPGRTPPKAVLGEYHPMMIIAFDNAEHLTDGSTPLNHIGPADKPKSRHRYCPKRYGRCPQRMWMRRRAYESGLCLRGWNYSLTWQRPRSA